MRERLHAAARATILGVGLIFAVISLGLSSTVGFVVLVGALAVLSLTAQTRPPAWTWTAVAVGLGGILSTVFFILVSAQLPVPTSPSLFQRLTIGAAFAGLLVGLEDLLRALLAVVRQ